MERIDRGGSCQISYTGSVSSSAFSLVSFNFDSVGYGSCYSGDVYGFSWCSVDMVLYLVVSKCSSLVRPGLIIDMGVSFFTGVLIWVHLYMMFVAKFHFMTI